MRLVVVEGLLRQTFHALRQCGRGCAECVVYWTSSVDSPDRLDELLHPTHRATSAGYDLDDQWLTNSAFDLIERRRSIQVQIHTHPRDAYHYTN